MMRARETIVTNRPVSVERVPDGTPIELPQGTTGQITQALGSSFTLVVGGQMVRLKGVDADAIGKEPPVDIVELGLVYVCDVLPVEDGDYRVSIKMTLTAPGCGMGEILTNEVADKLMALPHIADVQVDLVFDPPWDRCRMSEAAQLTLGL